MLAEGIRVTGFVLAGEGPITVGVRPESFVLGDGTDGLFAEVLLFAVELVGAEIYVHWTPGDGTTPLIFRVPGPSGLNLGQRA